MNTKDTTPEPDRLPELRRQLANMRRESVEADAEEARLTERVQELQGEAQARRMARKKLQREIDRLERSQPAPPIQP